MKQYFLSNSQQSTRMFRNNLMERLSKVHFYVPLLIYVPLIIYLLFKAFNGLSGHVEKILLWFVFGFFVWTLTEYLLHRYVFHFYPESKWGKRIHFIFHGVHHDYPNDAKRLVMPPSASIPLALIFYLIFSLFLKGATLYAFFAGFMLGYLFYDMVHYALHHLNFKHSFWKKLKAQHMRHHYADPSKGFGVSWKIWDKVFGSDFRK